MKRTFLYNVIFMITSGAIIKILGLLNKILLVRILGIDGIYLYTLSFPTIALLLTISSFGLPLAISKIISEKIVTKPYSNRSLIIKSLILSLIISLILIILLLIFINTLCNNWLKNPNLYYPILSSIPLIPLSSFTGVLKGYLNGYKIMDIASKSNIYEQITRIIFSLSLSLLFIKYNLILAVCGAILALSFGEFISLIYLLIKIRKMTNYKILINKNKEINQVISLCIPITLSKIIASISCFLEPIIFTYSLSKLGLNEKMISYLYGSILGFALPLLTLLSFIVSSFQTAILPIISESYFKKDYESIYKHINKSISYIMYPAGVLVVLLTFYSNEYMKIIYNTTNGSNFVSFMSPFFILFYFEGIFIGVIEGINKTTQALIINTFSQIIKLILIYYFSKSPNFHTYGLPLAIIIAMTFNTFFYYYLINKYTKYHINIKRLIYIVIIILTSFILGYNLRNINFIIGSFIIILYYTALYIFNNNKLTTVEVCEKNIF